MPTTNGELNLQLERTEAAWAQCAAEVDAIIDCHEVDDAKAKLTTPTLAR